MDVNQLINTIQYEYQKGDFEKALYFSRSLGRKLEKIPRAALHYAICLFFEGRILVDQDSLMEAEDILLRCQQIYTEKERKGEGYYLMASLALGDLHFKSRDNDQAEKYYRELEESESYGSDIGVKTKIDHKYAVMSERRRKYREAIEWYDKYLMSFSKLHNNEAPTYIEFERYKEKLKLALRAKETSYQGDYMDSQGFIHGNLPRGGSVMMDIPFAQYLVSGLPDPRNEDVEKTISRSTLMIVNSKETEERITLNDQLRITITDIFRVHELDEGHIMRIGDYTFQFYDKGGQRIGVIEYFKEGLIRMRDRWKPDAKIVSKERIDKWINEWIK